MMKFLRPCRYISSFCLWICCCYFKVDVDVDVDVDVEYQQFLFVDISTHINHM